MAITISYTSRSHGVVWKSGEIYTFHYTSWINDPKPSVILLYRVDGIHPRTGHQHRYYQAINLNYIPRRDRKKFAQEWQREYTRSNGDIEFTWDLVQNRYPYLTGAVRRYFFKPNYYIQNAVHVPMDQMEDVIVSSWAKDFSKKVKSSLVKKFRSLMGRRKAKGII